MSDSSFPDQDEPVVNGSDDAMGNDDQDGTDFVFNSGIIRKTEYFDLFISYKRDNGGDHGQELAVKLHKKLTEDGFKVWLDNEEIGYSSNFERRIEEAIVHSKKFICILGPKWVESPNCRYEVKSAIALEKRIIPVFYQEFRGLLEEKKNEGELTDLEWNGIAKPQQVDFSEPSIFDESYKTLKALCEFKDETTIQFTKVLCESYYWKKYKHPKSMLLFGDELSRVKTLRNQCSGENELPTFTAIQDAFITASEKFVLEEVSNKRKVFLSFDMHELVYAAELNMELRLNNISTWFDAGLAGERRDDSFIKPIINCESIIDITTDLGEVEEDHRISFARSKNKPVIRLTDSLEIKKEHEDRGVKNVHYWDGHARIDALLISVNGDKIYNAEHSALLEDAHEWVESDKHISKLLPYREAILWQEWYLKAEKLGTEPQPNLDMISLVERSVTHAVGLRKRKKLTLWSALVGIVFLVVLGLSTWYLLNEKNNADIRGVRLEKKAMLLKKSEEQAHVLAVDSQEASRISKIAKQKSDSSATLSKLAEVQANFEAKRSDQARLKSVIAAEKATNQAERAYQMAEFSAREAIASSLEAGKYLELAVQARKDSVLTIRILDSLAKQLEMANSMMTDAQLLASKYGAISFAQNEALRSLKFYQIGDKDSALVAANLAYNFLPLDSNSVPMQIQSLYSAYSNILPKSSVLNSGNRGKEAKLEKLRSDLHKRDDLKKLFDVSDSLVVKINEVEISVRHANKSPKNKIKALLKNSEYRDITSVCISSYNNWVAIGYKSGKLLICDLKTTEVIYSLKLSTSEIGSIAISQDRTVLTISTGPNEFSIVHLNDDGGLNKLHEIIKINSNSKIQRMYFWNNDILITIDANERAMAWIVNLDALKKEANKD